jgi:hypothetical protein
VTPEQIELVSALLADALPGTWVAVNRDGEVRVVVPKGPPGQFTLAYSHRPEGVA